MYTKRIDKVSRDITMFSEKLKANLIFKMKKELHERVYSDTIFSNRDNSFCHSNRIKFIRNCMTSLKDKFYKGLDLKLSDNLTNRMDNKLANNFYGYLLNKLNYSLYWQLDLVYCNRIADEIHVSLTDEK